MFLFIGKSHNSRKNDILERLVAMFGFYLTFDFGAGVLRI
jgi:hypothetical protein